MRQHRTVLAGSLAAIVSMAVAEFVAGLLTGAVTPVIAAGSVVVDFAPPAARDTSIALFGTANKTALAVGTAAALVGTGAGLGALAARNMAASLLGIGALTAIGLLAAAADAGSQFPATAATTLASGAAATAAMVWLVAVLRPGAENEEPARADPDRRRVIGIVGGTVAAAAVVSAAGRWGLPAVGRGPDHAAMVELPPAAVPAAPPGASHAFAVRGIEPVVVPAGRFFRIDTALVVPRIDPARWRLHITGMVDRDIELTYDDLLAMPLVEDYVTLACVSNEVGGPLVGNALWTGVPLRELLERAGVRPGAGQIVGRSTDGWTAGFPVEAAFDGREPLVAVGMNGETLPARHGFPARLVVPGLYGYVSATKWLSQIELTTWEGYDAYWVPRGWAKQGPIKMQSRIDVPRSGASLSAGRATVAGVAWAPLSGVSSVEVRVDDGDWLHAERTEPLSDAAWIQWRATVELSSGRHDVAVRATDAHGMIQTDVRSGVRPDGATGHHTISVTAT